MEEHNEFVVEYKDGHRDWIDPVTAVREDDYCIYVESICYTYEIDKAQVDKWVVRPYTPETTYDYIGELKCIGIIA